MNPSFLFKSKITNKKILAAAFTAIGAIVAYFSSPDQLPSESVSLPAASLTNPKKHSSAQPAKTLDGALYIAVSCNDGDTCRLRTADNKDIKIRMVGIDAPEFGGKKKQGQPMAPESKEFLNKLVAGKEVQINSFGTDVYQRVLGEIHMDDTNVNLEMVKQGFAEVYHGSPPKGLDLAKYQGAERNARNLKIGIWSLENYESPKDFRKRTKK